MAGLLDFAGSAPSGGGGLLDFVFSDPGARAGLTMLAASSPKYGRGLLAAMQSQDEMQKNALQQQYIQSQIAENASQAKQREMQIQSAMQQQAREAAFFGLGGGSPKPTTQGAGMISGGEDAGSGAPSESKFDEWSRQFGIPKDALVVDYLKNGGKGIAEMIAKRGTPDMQVTNGYAYDRNKLGAGFMPSLQTSQDGKSTMTRIGPDGLPVVSAPRGALETFAGYQGAQASFKPIKVYNQATGREEYTDEASVVRPQGRASARPQQQYSGPGYNGGSAANAATEQLRIIQSEYDKLPQGHPDRPALMREMQRLGGGQVAQSGNFAAGPSAAETAANEAARARAVDTAKADVVRDTDSRTKVRNAKENLSNADRAIELLQLGPTGSAIGALVDKGASVFGKSTPGGNIAAQLDIVSANMVKNVPRFEGPQSNIDVEGYKAAAGRVADRSLPIEQRLAAAQEVKYFEQKALRQAGGGASGSWDEPEKKEAGKQREFSMLPNAKQYDGKRMQAPDGTIYRSRGGQWVKE